MFKLAILIFIIYLFASVEMTGEGESDLCVESSKIVSIGGCDRYAYCGVKLENGNETRKEYPVIGEYMCVKQISTFKWKWLWIEQ